MLHITFRSAREARVCEQSYHILAKALGGVRSYGRDTPIPVTKVLEVCGLKDALWALRCTIEPCEREKRLLASAFAEHVLHFFETAFPLDRRPRHAIETARLFAEGKATPEELKAAAHAAHAADAAYAATHAAHAAAYAAHAADAAYATAHAAEMAWQEGKLTQMLTTEEIGKDGR